MNRQSYPLDLESTARPARRRRVGEILAELDETMPEGPKQRGGVPAHLSPWATGRLSRRAA